MLKHGIALRHHKTNLLQDILENKEWDVIVDKENDEQENAILLTVGHRDTILHTTGLVNVSEAIKILGL